jgi:hypothetical protein
MAKKKEKILTQEQMEDIVLFAYNLLKDGYSMNFIKERYISIENDIHYCKIITSLLGDNKKIVIITIKNKVHEKEISLSLHDLEDRINIQKQLNYLQEEVNNIIDENKPIYYSDDEIGDIIGDPSLLGKRSAKVEHLIDNIEEKRSKKRFKWSR